MGMNETELKNEFKSLMPNKIQGNKRPSDPIASDNDFFLDVPQLIKKDPVVNDSMNLILSVALSNDRYLRDSLNTIQNGLNLFDFRTATQTIKGLMSATDKAKLDGIEEKANNYKHPTSGVVANTYTRVTVNELGHVTSGNNPTTLAGYGITNAPTKTGDGATGTWGIDISGTAEKANTATLATNAEYAITAGTATTLQTARDIAITDGTTTGDAASFDGSGNIALSLPNTVALKSDVKAENVGGIVACQFAENGYVKFANGLIIQWGTRVISPVTFPTAFKSACLMVLPQVDTNSGSDDDSDAYRVFIASKTKTGFSTAGGGNYLKYIAIGY